MTIQAQDTLLVPMGLKALVMPTQNYQQDWDRRTLSYKNLNEYKSPLPPPFSNSGDAGTGEVPPTGVHLYWTLPHALTKALTQQDIETAEANSGAIETAEDNSGTVSESGYPFIPNRWLVVRIPDTGNAAAWVVMSDEIDEEKGQTPYVDPFDLTKGNVVNPVKIGIQKALADWAASQGEDSGSQPPYLTIIAPGNANFSAFTPGNQNVFSFYDDLDGLDNATLRYAVLGWYSDPVADPINPANPVNGGTVQWILQPDDGLSVVSRLG